MSEAPMDLEIVKEIAKASAVAATEEVAAKFREDLREQLRAEFKAHFGDMEAAKHIIAHDRMERLLRLVDRLGENVFGKLLQHFVYGALLVCAIGYAAWLKFTGGQL